MIRAHKNSESLSTWLEAPVRKSKNLSRLAVAKLRAFSPRRFLRSPQVPVLCNSFPKSGTHLLMQVLEALPETEFFGRFIATQISTSLRVRSKNEICEDVASLIDGELCPGHLEFSGAVSNAVASRGVMHVLIVRDLREVVLSEAHYVSEMNPWHGLHRHFRQLPTFEDRVLFAAEGQSFMQVPGEFLDIGSRFMRYARWLKHPGVLVVRFESLRQNLSHEAGRIALHHTPSLTSVELKRAVELLVANVRPSRSHTYSGSARRQWRDLPLDIQRRVEAAIGGANEQIFDL